MAKTAFVAIEGVTAFTFSQSIGQKITDFHQKVAEKVLKDAVSRGFDNQPIVVTDGVANRDWAQVKPFGKIEFDRRPMLQECARWIMAQLVDRSPVGPGRNGHYKDKHVYLVNGEQVSDQHLDKVKPSDRLQIVNTQPYAKKLEGERAQRRFKLKRERGSSVQAPGGIYTIVQRLAFQRYGRSLFIDFKYVQLNLDRPQVMRRRAHGKKLAVPRAVNPVYPAIQLHIRTVNQ